MARPTLGREWTELDRDLAERICDAVAAADGRLTGALAVARAVGLPCAKRTRARALRRIYDVMPLAVIITPDRFPGKALLVMRDRTYSITDSRADAKLTASDRLKRISTMMQRVDAEITALREASDLGSIMAVKMVDTVNSGLDTVVWDAIVAEAEANGAA